MATEARRRYCDDAERVWEEEVVVTGDMMRVTMLPISPLKECKLTPRVVCFNETFAIALPEDKVRRRQRRQQNRQHDCMRGHRRSAEAVAASFLIYLKTTCRDVRKVTMWLDNC